MSKLSERRREIRGMDLTSAADELKTLRRQLFDLRIQKERGEVKDTRQFAKTKADIARLIHHISELHHAEAVEAEGGLEPEEVAAAAVAATGTTTTTTAAREKTGAAPRRRATVAASAPTATAPTATQPEETETAPSGAPAGTRATATPSQTVTAAGAGGLVEPRPAPEPPTATEEPASTTGSEDEGA